MANLPVTSREYKLMLNPDRFRERAAGSDAFLDVVKFVIDKEGGAYLTQDEVNTALGKTKSDAVRRTWYLDTHEMGLREHGLILRVREELKKKQGEERLEYELNLKFRGPDRYLAAGKDVGSAAGALGGKADGKFEEDVLPPFRSQLSRSVSIEKLEAEPTFADLAALAAVFPGLGALGLPGDSPVQVANDFRAHEVVLRIGGFVPKTKPDLPLVKMSLSFWYLQKAAEGWPMVGEFSFDYEAVKEDGTKAGALEEFAAEAVELAGKVFRSLQLQSGWLDLNGTTKSAFAVSGV